ncbi:MAG TPA: sulfatase-like hydrolase/transferase [Acidobacteriaceae bacterium]|nr:sulfatase-like hydrolase/transferase [Acidobacteriaceae bacterium]
MKVTRREITKTLAAAGIGSALGSGVSLAQGSTTARRQPNILFIITDQHSGQMLMGGPGKAVPVRTPNMERLAAKGVRFQNTYCASPLCAPGRAALMTGRFASDVDSYGNALPIQDDAPTWGNYLRDAGYTCWSTGKFDLATRSDNGFEGGSRPGSNEHAVRPDITELFRRPMCYRLDEREQIDGTADEKAHAPDKAKLQEGLAFVRAHAGDSKPWAAYVGLTTPHPPFRAPQRYLDLYPPADMPLPNVPAGYLETLHPVFQTLRDFSRLSTPFSEQRIRRARSAYYASITQLDDDLGEVLDALERAGTFDNTVVIYTSDHGEMLGEHGLWLKRALFEGAARVPLIMAGAGLPAGKVIDAPVSALDLTATLLDLGGVPKQPALRGRSLLPLIAGDTTAAPPVVYSECHTEGNCTGSFMVRKGDWKYLYFSFYGSNLLFNLRNDPGERTSLAGRPETAAIEKELHDALTSLVDPDAVTLRAFAKQEAFLANMIRTNSAHDFYSTISGRLGRGQAALLTQQHYPAWKPA